VVYVELQVDRSYLKAVGVNDLYATIVSKVAKLQVLANHADTDSSIVIPRFRTRFAHLNGRLLHLTKLGVFPQGITCDDYQQLHEQLASGKRSIHALAATGRPIVRKDEGDDISNVELVPVRPAIFCRMLRRYKMAVM
jgi:hypothetical protein